MRAIVIEKAGPPEVLEIKEIPKPVPGEGQVLIRVRAFGLNRSELFTRLGFSPGVKFPRVLGIECVGEVEAAPGSDLKPGQRVAAMMGGMGRAFDGGYAEYTCVPASQAIPVETELGWETFGALPETYLTVWRIFEDGLDLSGKTLLVRGGTSSIGMAAISLGKDRGLEVAATTRNPAKEDVLKKAGADHVIIDEGAIAEKVRAVFPGGAANLIELIGVNTLPDSLQSAGPKGFVCMAGHLSGEWTAKEMEVMGTFPYGVRFTTINTHGLARENAQGPLQNIVDAVQAGRLPAHLDKVFPFEAIAEAHRYMEENRASGKIVMRVPD